MKKQGVHRGKGPMRKLCVCMLMYAYEKVCTSNRVCRHVCVCVLRKSGALYGQSEGELRD